MLDPIKSTFLEVSEKLGALTSNGVSYFKGNLGQILLYISPEAKEDSDIDRDETHYFLVPHGSSASQYSLFVKRLLPSGVGSSNELPKVKIFHLPSESAQEKLDHLILANLSEKQLANIDTSAPLAERLEMISEEIDKSGTLITGGLILIGGVVAIANPLLGVGIAAKALIPSLGSKFSTHG